MKKPVKKKRTGWHPASEPPKDARTKIVCNNILGWMTTANYVRGKWCFDCDPDGLQPTHWHDYPKLPKDED